jgi:hypothetical protein
MRVNVSQRSRPPRGRGGLRGGGVTAFVYTLTLLCNHDGLPAARVAAGSTTTAEQLSAKARPACELLLTVQLHFQDEWPHLFCELLVK